MKSGNRSTSDPERRKANKDLTNQIRQHEDKLLLVLTLIIGAIVGVVVVGFILLTENLGARLYPATSSAWRRVLIPLLGALGTGILLHRYFPEARGSGIPQTKAALFLRDGYISFRTVLGKFGLCSVSLASGIALGREGPSVHVGAGIASTLGRRLGLSAASVKALVPTGASAALAAAFNTPISAVLFSLEEVMGDMNAPVLGSIVLSSATSWIVLHLILGDEPLFHVPAYQLVHAFEFVFYAVLGVVGGLVSTAFVKLLLWQRHYFLRAPKSMRWFLPSVGGLTVGLLGWFFPDVLGVGYSFVGKALNGQIVAGTMALLVLLKMLATATCYASGNAGGIFGPSLFLGAMMGGSVGSVAHMLIPDYTGSVGAYALVGMGAAFAGIVRVPLTSVIMVFEITRDYSIIVPLMIANLISYFIASRLQNEPIYEALQHQDGIHVPSGTRARTDLLMVGHAYRPQSQVLSASETISQAAASVDRQYGAWAVVDEQGLRGTVSLEQFDEATAAGRGDEPLGELVRPPPAGAERTAAVFPHVHPDHPLETAMRRLAETRMNMLPVVSRTNIRELKGTISVADILAAYAIGRDDAQPATKDTGISRIPMRLLWGVLAAMIAVAIVAAFLNYFYRSERSKRAERYYQAGNDLAQKERLPEAIAQYRNALSISHRFEHRLALALTLVKAEHPDEASIYLNEILRERPDDGPANLGMATIAAQQGHTNEAVVHYQRAIYGSWPEQPIENRIKARMELVEALGKAGRRQQAQAELVGLAANLPSDPALEKQVGQMMIQFGLPGEAVELYRNLLKRSEHDASAYSGLGEAEFAAGDYAAARTAFRSALNIDPTDQKASRRLETCEKIMTLDPTQRRLGSRERFRRSEEILKSVLNELMSCVPSGTDPPDLEAVQAARSALAHRRPPVSFFDAAEVNFSLAERLWAGRNKACPNRPSDDPLCRVMSKLASR